jgi:hypothetical protein
MHNNVQFLCPEVDSEKKILIVPTHRLNSWMNLFSKEIPFDTVMFLSNKSSAASAFLRTAYRAGGDEFGSPTFINIFLPMEKKYTNAIRYHASTWPICSIPFPRRGFGPRFGARLWLHNIKTTFSSRGADCRGRRAIGNHRG